MKILFMGTPEFAQKSLEALIENNYNIVGVFTQPDKPKGRGMKLAPPPVKEIALKHNIPVFQPKSLKDQETFEIIKNLDPDVIAVAAYGKILPKNILDYPKYGCINVHASLLPKYRGASPIRWCIIRGEEKSGVTIMYMNEGLDTGDMILKEEVPIPEDMTAGELHDILAELGAKLLVKTLKDIKGGKITRTPQDDSKASYAPMLTKETGEINWQKSAREIKNLVRGLCPWPVAYTKHEGRVIKVYSVKIVDMKGKPGEVLVSNDRDGLIVACSDGALLLDEIQIEGKRRMKSTEFLRGHRIDEGITLG